MKRYKLALILLLTLRSFSISAQEDYRISKPVMIDGKYCWQRPDVINIIHIMEKAKECDTLITSYQDAECLYLSSLSTKDSVIGIQKKMLGHKDQIIDGYSRQTEIMVRQIKSAQKGAKKTKWKLFGTSISLGCISLAIGAALLKTLIK